jgi:hypothetical protein
METRKFRLVFAALLGALAAWAVRAPAPEGPSCFAAAAPQAGAAAVPAAGSAPSVDGSAIFGLRYGEGFEARTEHAPIAATGSATTREFAPAEAGGTALGSPGSAGAGRAPAPQAPIKGGLPCKSDI